MPDTAKVQQLWSAFLQSRPDLPSDLSFYEAFSFGSHPESASLLAALVLAGVKTATSEALQVYEHSGQRPPERGDFSIVLDGHEEPVCVMETLETRIVPFTEVDDAFACDYGEGDRSIEWWRSAMWEYYQEEFSTRGWSASSDMLLVCERFRVVFVPDDQMGPIRDA